jgi:predicted DNA-binding transcriptional regulator AlpA
MNTETGLLNEREAARRLGLSVATMRRRRLLRHPPAWVKLGARVLYQSEELAAFVDANVVRLPPPASSLRRAR